jgi:hypothetical protein
MMLAEGLLLGLASGGACLTLCAPVLVPYLLGEGRTARANLVPVGGFLAGRLAGYMTFAVLAWLTHSLLIETLPHQKATFGIVAVALALLLIVYGFTGRDRSCRTTCAGAAASPKRRNLAIMPVTMGFLTGVNVCPPFLLAFSSAAQLPRLWQGLLFFAAFFVGTSVYVAPLPLVGLVGGCERIRIIARLAAGVVGLFYLYSGIVSIIIAVH